MNTAKLNWTTKPQADSTHVIDDEGTIYWTVAPGKSNDEVAAAFVEHYDGYPYPFDVTTMATGENSKYGS